MPKVIRFISSNLESFTNHRKQTIDYGSITKLSGKNGQGKTSIGTAPVWVLYGTDLLGAKFNPSPTNYEFDRVYADLLLSVDGTQILLAREIENGENKFYINEVPTKAKEYEAFVADLFDKELFLSLYNPAYFFTQHWTKQRAQVMKNVSAPTNKEVFEEMSRTSPDQKGKDITLNPQAAKLAEELKKLSIADLGKKHTDLKDKNDKLHIQSQGSVKTLNAQLQALGPAVAVDRMAVVAELEMLRAKIKTFDADKLKTAERAMQIQQLTDKIESLNRDIEQGKADAEAARAQQIEADCKACGQSLTEEAKGKASETRKIGINSLVDKVNGLITLRKTVRDKLAETKPLPESDYTVTDLIERTNELNTLLQSDAARVKAAADLEKAKQNESDYLKAKNDSIFVLDAIKAFNAKEAELQVGKVQALFTTLSVRLHKYIKSSDEYEPDFSIQMHGKDYNILSVGEKITAGLELTEVLFKQSDLIVPTFIDGIESYTGAVAVYDQLITGRAVPGQDLKIEAEDAA